MSRRFYAELAPAIASNGYPIVPIKPRLKAPAAAAWQETIFDPADEHFANCGVGILCGAVRPDASVIYALDIDFMDTQFVDDLCEYIVEKVCDGDRPLFRIGQAPKTLLVFAGAEDGLRKRFSAQYHLEGILDSKGKPKINRVEMLGLGQQFVAYGIHPDTRVAYGWDGASLLDTPAFELPVLTPEKVDAVFAWVEQHAKKQKGFKLIQKAADKAPLMKDYPTGEDEDGVVAMDLPCDNVNLENATEYLKWYEGGYDDWIEILMAFHTQFGGSEEALDVVDEWSSGQPGYAGREDVEYHWQSFGKSGSGGKTFRSILYRHVEWLKTQRQAERAALEDVDRDLLRRVEDCRLMGNHAGYTELNDRVIPDIQKVMKREFPDRTRFFKSKVRAALKACAGGQLNISEAALDKKLFPPENRTVTSTKDEMSREFWRERSPSWARGWVYISSEDIFFDTIDSYIPTSRRGFDGRMAPWLATVGDADGAGGGQITASTFLLNGNLVPVCDTLGYDPSEDWIFFDSGRLICNTFKRNLIAKPKPEKKWSDADKMAVDTVDKHLRRLCSGISLDETLEYRVLVSFLRHIVEHPGVKVRWCPLIIGPERSGKSFCFDLLLTLLGSENAKPINSATIMSSASSSFSDWAYGSAIAAIEELKMHGHNRFDVINFLKDKLTNNMIEVHRKGKAPEWKKNTQSYIAFSNFYDCLPIDADNAKWFVIGSPFTKEQAYSISRDYYDDLFGALKHRGALMAWLLSVPYAPEFNPDRGAPDTAGKARVAAEATPFGDMESEDASVFAYETLTPLLLASKNPNYCKDVAIPKFIARDLGLSYHGNRKASGALLDALRLLGFEPVAAKMRGIISGEQVVPWGRKCPYTFNSERARDWFMKILETHRLMVGYKFTENSDLLDSAPEDPDQI